MLRVCTGVPRSGKSYYVVKQLLEHCQYDPISGQYDLLPGVLIVTNIDGLKLNHRTLKKELESVPVEELRTKYTKYPSEVETEYTLRVQLTEYFNVDRWMKESEKYKKIIFAIDEAQTMFPASTRTLPNSVFYFFEYHGHFGADIYLMAQGAEAIHRRILVINETFVEAESPTMRPLKQALRYYLKDSKQNTIVSTQVLSKDPMVYKAYKSARHEEGIKERKSFITKYYYIAAIMILAFPPMLYLFYSQFKSLGGEDDTHEQKLAKSEIQNVNEGNENPLKGIIQEEILTRSGYLKAQHEGMEYEDTEELPESCYATSKVYVCPEMQLPEFVKSVTLSKVCRMNEEKKKYDCKVIIPIAKLKERKNQAKVEKEVPKIEEYVTEKI